MATQELVTVRPPNTGEELVNPGMGWVLHYYDNIPRNYGSRLAPSDTVDEFPGLSTIYLRLAWSFLEPEEGQFAWSVVDTPAQRWIAKGKRIAFRFSTSESFLEYATPRWVEQAGAKGYRFPTASGPGVDPQGKYWEPDFDDPIFLEKLDHFLAAAAARYDGDPRVDFVDVGTFGVWGEGHTYASTLLPYSADTALRHVELHRKHFRNTLLVANDDWVYQDRGEAWIQPALAAGLTLRDDSVLVQGGEDAYFHAAMAQPFWPTRPVILESEHYGMSRDRGRWGDGSKYLQAVEEYHASYASIHWWPREFLQDCRDLIYRMNLRLGYRLRVVEASWPARVKAAAGLPFRAHWQNAGVAPCYGGGHPALTLKDPQAGLVAVCVDEHFNVADLPVAPPDQAETRTQETTFPLPFQLQPGRYDVFLSVGSRIGTPHLALPLPECDGQRRYRLGEITVE